MGVKFSTTATLVNAILAKESCQANKNSAIADGPLISIPLLYRKISFGGDSIKHGLWTTGYKTCAGLASLIITG